MFRFSGWELIIVLVIVLLLFGPGRIGKIAGELGRGIRSFREGISGQKDVEEPKKDETPPPPS
jgi:sec-independent protein translocase protein TatA